MENKFFYFLGNRIKEYDIFVIKSKKQQIKTENLNRNHTDSYFISSILLQQPAYLFISHMTE